MAEIASVLASSDWLPNDLRSISLAAVGRVTSMSFFLATSPAVALVHFLSIPLWLLLPLSVVGAVLHSCTLKTSR